LVVVVGGGGGEITSLRAAKAGSAFGLKSQGSISVKLEGSSIKLWNIHRQEGKAGQTTALVGAHKSAALWSSSEGGGKIESARKREEKEGKASSC
jgi:hypothetical protein